MYYVFYADRLWGIYKGLSEYLAAERPDSYWSYNTYRDGSMWRYHELGKLNLIDDPPDNLKALLLLLL